MAHPFRFRLARVQRVRELYEESARAEFGIALGEANSAGAYVEYLRAQVTAARASLAQLQERPLLDPASLLAQDKCITSILALVMPAKKRHREMMVAAERARNLWIEKKADAQALEKLEKRAKDRHREELHSKENAEQDEVAVQRSFARTRSEEGT
jgi:flagellar export protein FliJ